MIRATVRAALQEPQAPCTAATGHRTGTRRVPGTGRDGQTRTWSAPAALKAIASGQKMSGGLQAWITANRPRRVRRVRAGVFHAVAANEYAYSATKLSLLPPGAYGSVLVQLNAIDDLVARVTLALGAHYGDLVAGPGQGLALQPYPPVKGHRKVLDNDQDSCHVRGSSHAQ